MTNPDVRNDSPQALAERLLDHLKTLLEEEHDAIVKADAKEVARLAREKDKIADALALIDPEVQAAGEAPRNLKELSRQVKRLSSLNHALLTQLYRHYHGMLEFLTRVAGHGQTYGRGGTLDLAPSTLRGKKAVV